MILHNSNIFNCQINTIWHVIIKYKDILKQGINIIEFVLIGQFCINLSWLQSGFVCSLDWYYLIWTPMQGCDSCLFILCHCCNCKMQNSRLLNIISEPTCTIHFKFYIGKISWLEENGKFLATKNVNEYLSSFLRTKNSISHL